MARIPFDLQAAPAGCDNAMPWPVAQGELRDVAQLLVRLVGDAACLGQGSAALALAAPTIVSQSMILLETAWLIDAAAERGDVVIGGPPEADWLRGETGVLPALQLRRPVEAQNPLMRRLRETVRTASWTGLSRLTNTVLRPEVLAINHNPLLRQQAALSGQRIRYCDSGSLLAAARSHAEEMVDDTPAETRREAERLSAATAALLPLQGRAAARLPALLSAKIVALFDRARRDLEALQHLKLDAMQLWSGTGGNYAARALGLEVRRRGGVVRRFDHGGSTGMLAMGEPLALTEGVGADSFICFTPGLARICRNGPLGSVTRRWSGADFNAATGDPHTARLLRGLKARSALAQRVMLVTGALVGFRQVVPPVPRDPVYLAWHLHLAQQLLSLPYNISFKPHPEGIFRGRRHPFHDLGQTLTVPFESCLADIDVLVFDFPLSTTFWAALCTHKPIVLIDLGFAPLNPVVDAMVRRRCVVVPGHWPPGGQPRIGAEILADALDLALRDPRDPAPFRALYLNKVDRTT